ncbi:hypothetical protein Ddc_19507 [Ditylenchus destructor]|nr:hypothetical protein Ddc_19507 [Ditylenchus destructor]
MQKQTTMFQQNGQRLRLCPVGTDHDVRQVEWRWRTCLHRFLVCCQCLWKLMECVKEKDGWDVSCQACCKKPWSFAILPSGKKNSDKDKDEADKVSEAIEKDAEKQAQQIADSTSRKQNWFHKQQNATSSYYHKDFKMSGNLVSLKSLIELGSKFGGYGIASVAVAGGFVVIIRIFNNGCICSVRCCGCKDAQVCQLQPVFKPKKEDKDSRDKEEALDPVKEAKDRIKEADEIAAGMEARKGWFNFKLNS